MALSFILKELVGASSLQAFAAGASLSATSLGTTFTILSTTGLVTTRLGIVTTSAAMLDDVVGLVMVQIISNLGVNSSFNAITVIRPVFVSIGFAIGLYLLCAFGIKPVLKKVLAMKFKTPSFVGTMQFAFLYQTVILVGLVAGATYAGTSSLFAAYLAGVIVSWLDEILMHSQVLDSSASLQTGPSTSTQVNSTHTHTERARAGASNKGLTGECVYDKYYKQPIKRILIPLFFVSLVPRAQL
jgi:Kef-type K+ transport systems, membrane components